MMIALDRLRELFKPNHIEIFIVRKSAKLSTVTKLSIIDFRSAFPMTKQLRSIYTENLKTAETNTEKN